MSGQGKATGAKRQAAAPSSSASKATKRPAKAKAMLQRACLSFKSSTECLSLMADEKRKAAKAANEADFAEARGKHAAEMATLEQECAERLSLMEEDIAAEEGNLGSHAQFD